jgi:hypothetical protein
MRASHVFSRTLAVALLSLTLVLVVGGAYVNAYQSPPYPFPPTFPVNSFDFTISTSATLIRIQPGQSGGLVVWVNLYCPNSTTTIRCDSTVLQTVDLTFSGCPGGAFCILDKQQVLLPPSYQAGSNFLIYTFYTLPAGTAPPVSSSVSSSLITVTGTDQFGHTHSTSFGAVVCYC